MTKSHKSDEEKRRARKIVIDLGSRMAGRHRAAMNSRMAGLPPQSPGLRLVRRNWAEALASLPPGIGPADREALEAAAFAVADCSPAPAVAWLRSFVDAYNAGQGLPPGFGSGKPYATPGGLPVSLTDYATRCPFCVGAYGQHASGCGDERGFDPESTSPR